MKTDSRETGRAGKGEKPGKFKYPKMFLPPCRLITIFLIYLAILLSPTVLAQNKFSFYKGSNLLISTIDREVSLLGSDIKIKNEKIINTSKYYTYSVMPEDVLSNIQFSEDMGFYSALQSMTDENSWIFVEIMKDKEYYNVCFYDHESKTKNIIFTQEKSPDKKYTYIPFAWNNDILFLEAKVIGSSTENEGIWSYNLVTDEFSKLSLSPNYLTTPIISPNGKYLIYGGTQDITRNLDSPMNIIYIYDISENVEVTVESDINTWYSILGWYEDSLETNDLISIYYEEESMRLKSANQVPFKFPWASGTSYCCNTGATPAPPGPIGSTTICTNQNPHKYIGFDFINHNDIDGSVLAVADGEIDFAGWQSTDHSIGFGLYVRIEHSDGTYTYYGHLKSISVSVGDNVQQGCRIGIKGTTGESSGEHIHFECRDVGKARYTNSWPVFGECGCTPHQNYLYTSNNEEVSCGVTAPDNDHCSDAESITSNGSSKIGTIEGATTSYGPNACDGCGGCDKSKDDNDVYYKFVAKATSHTVTVNTASNDFDAVIELRTDCGYNTSIGCWDPSNKPTTVSHPWDNLTIGKTYYIRVYEYNNSATPPSSPEFEIFVTHETITQKPDLIVQNAQVSQTTVTMEQQITATCFNKNQGTGNASSSVTSLWFSKDQNFDNSDYYLGEISVSSLNAGATSSKLSKQITIPTGPYSLGTWYIMFGADGGDDNVESSESNNQVFVQISLQGSTLTVSPSSLTLGTTSNSNDQIQVTSNVSWTVSDDASWLTVSPTSGSNNGTITVTATSANSSTNARSGTVTITGSGVTRTVTVSQSGISSNLDVIPTNLTIGAILNSTEQIDINSNVNWTASDNATWLSLNPSSGSNNGTITLTVTSANTSTSIRSGMVTITGGGITRTVSVAQDGASLYLDVTPLSITIGASLNSTEQITVSSNVNWSASDNAPWLSVSPISGSNNGTITLTAISANTSTTSRNGTVIITGDGITRTVTVTQSGTQITPSLIVDPTSLTLALASNSSGQINVTSNGSWTASDDATWLTVSPANGSNNGTISVTATSANPSTTNTRSGIVTISGGGITRTVTVTQASSSSSCTSPVAKVNNPRGVAPLTFTCETLGGSGGNIAYKWYKGTSCAGTVIGTGQTLTVNESGYFSCKAYIEGNENNCFDCGTGEAKIEFQVCTNWTTTPGTQNVPVSGGKYEFLVSSTGGTCSRNTKSNDSWIHSVNYIGGGYWEYTVDANNTGNARTGSISVNNLQDGINDIIRLTVTQAGPPPPPAITVSTTSLPDFGSVQVNSNSTAQSFTVSGSNLTNDISLTAPSGFEISRSSGSDYKSSLSLTQSGGTVASTTIYVRFKPASTGLKSGNIAIKSTGAETKNVTVSGTGTTVSPPTIAVSTTSLPDFGGVLVNSNSSSQSFTVSGSNLSANISLSAPSGFEISKSSGSNYGATLSLTQTSGTVSNTTIYVRFSPTSAGAKSGEISVSSTGVATKKVAVSGTGTTVSPPTISVSQQSFSFGNVTVNTNSLPQSFTVSGSNLTTNISLSAPTGFEISKSSGSDYRTTLGLTQLGGTVSSSTIYVRFSPTSTEAKSGDITVSSTGATTKKVAVSGTGVRVSDCNLALSSNGLEFTSSSGNKTVNVTSNSSWIVSDDATWITVTPTSGSNNGTLTISVSNNSGAERSGIVTVSGCNNTTKTIIVTQSGPCNFSLARSSLDFSASPGGKTFNVTSNSGWTVSEDSSWISALPVSSFGNKSISISVTENNGHSRTGVVTFSACNQLFYLTVNQVGKITSIGDVETNGEIKIYPNPTTGIITIEGLPENKEVEISIFDINRKLIKKQTSISSVTKMDISDVVSGNYLLIIDDVVDTTFKIIKK